MRSSLVIANSQHSRTIRLLTYSVAHVVVTAECFIIAQIQMDFTWPQRPDYSERQQFEDGFALEVALDSDPSSGWCVTQKLLEPAGTCS